MVKVCEGPSQPLALGVTVIFACTGTTPLLIVENEGIFPVPEAANPMDGLSLVQLYAVGAIDPPPGTNTAFPVKLE